MSRTVWIINHYACKPEDGNASRHVDIAKQLSKHNVRVLIFASSYNHFTGEERIIEANVSHLRESIAENAEIIWLKTNFKYSNNGMKRIMNMLSFSAALIRGAAHFAAPDIIIGSSVHLFAPLTAYALSRRFKCRFASEIRDIWPLTLIELGKISRFNPIVLLFSLIERFVYMKSEFIIATMPGFETYCRALGIGTEVVYIPNGIDIPEKEELQDGIGSVVLSEFMDLVKDKFICVYAGSHGISNNLDVIIDAATIMLGEYDVLFAFIGSGPEKARLQAKVTAMDLTNVLFFNRVDKATLGKILSLSDIGIASLPDSTLYEYGISLNKLNDYMLHELPIILAGNAVRNPIEESGCGICTPPNDPHAIMEAVVKLKKMEISDRKATGSRGKLYLMEEHSMKVVSDKFLKAIALESPCRTDGSARG